MIRIKELRKQKNLSLVELGKKVGMSDSRLSQYETGRREPNIATLIKLANYFHVSIDYLAGRDVKKCPYCQTNGLSKDLLEHDEPIAGMSNACLSGEVDINATTMFLQVDSYDEGGFLVHKEINYCPMCGRKL